MVLLKSSPVLMHIMHSCLMWRELLGGLMLLAFGSHGSWPAEVQTDCSFYCLDLMVLLVLFGPGR